MFFINLIKHFHVSIKTLTLWELKRISSKSYLSSLTVHEVFITNFLYFSNRIYWKFYQEQYKQWQYETFDPIWFGIFCHLVVLWLDSSLFSSCFLSFVFLIFSYCYLWCFNHIILHHQFRFSLHKFWSSVHSRLFLFVISSGVSSLVHSFWFIYTVPSYNQSDIICLLFIRYQMFLWTGEFL